jgi:hypothetical protein
MMLRPRTRLPHCLPRALCPATRRLYASQTSLRPPSNNNNNNNHNNNGVTTTNAAASTDVALHPPPSLQDRQDRIAIQPPRDASPPPPAWMLRFFPHFFQPEDPKRVGPEEHHHPYGVVGVYGYIATLLLAGGLAVAHLWERFGTDSMEKARAAMLERRVLQEMEVLRAEHRRSSQEMEK